jgi:hypothetical protein
MRRLAPPPADVSLNGVYLIPARATVASTAATTTAAFARHGTSFIDHHSPAHQFLTMTGLDGLQRDGVVVNLSERKSARLSRETVSHHGHGVDGDAVAGKKVLHIRFVGRIRKVSYE